jgi:predicted DNA-binding protein with PD1-like motif
MKSVQIHNGFFVVFERGEDFIPLLVQFCEQEEIHWAQFQAIGALEDVEIGYYDLPTKEYVFRKEAGPFEVASMDGNIAEIEGERPLAHVHAVLSRCDETLETIGGHLRGARVALTLEVCLWLVTQPLIRDLDEETGLNLIQL